MDLEEIPENTNYHNKVNEIYFEQQTQDSALCGQHAINNLLQGSYFNEVDLGTIGTNLDKKEKLLLTDDNDNSFDNFGNDERKFNSYNNGSSSSLLSNGSRNGDKSYSNVSQSIRQKNFKN